MRSWSHERTLWAGRRLPIALVAIVAAGAAFCLVPVDSARADLATNLELYSPMDGTTDYLRAEYWQDATGNGYNAKQNIDPYDGGGARSTAANFYDTSARMRVWNGMDSALDPGTGDYSVSLWYYEEVHEGYNYLLTKGNNHGSGWSGYSLASVTTGDPAVTSVPKVRMNDVLESTSEPDTRASIISAGGSVGTGGWHHMVAVFDRSGTYGNANEVRFYVDNVEQGSAILEEIGFMTPYDLSPANPDLTSEYEMCIGGRSRYSSNDFEGYMDDVAVYQGALSPADVGTLYTATSLDASTITNPAVTPVMIHNFEANLNQAETPGIVRDAWDGNPGEIRYDAVEVFDPTRGANGSEVLAVDPTNNASGVNYGDILAPGSNSYTTAIWFKLENTGDQQMVVVKSNNHGSNDEGFSITIGHNSETDTPTLNIRACYEHDVDEARLSINKAMTYDDQWHHAALVIDQESGLLKGYLDGQGSGATGTDNGWELGYGNTFTPGGAVDFVPIDDPDLRLGIRYNGGYRFSGEMDDFAVWSRTLTDQEILDLYNGATFPSPDNIPGDTNGDRKVDSVDAQALASNWGITENATWSMGDFNKDGAVNMADASILAANWGDHTGGGGESVVPEPSALVMLVSLAMLAFRRRRVV